MGGTDNIKTSIGDKWQQGPINAPTVLNSSLNVAQFWDGRAADLKAQAGGPIANPGEMAFTTRWPSTCWSPFPPTCANSSRSSARTRSTSTRSRWPSPSSRRPWSRRTRASTSGCWARTDALTPTNSPATSCSRKAAASPATTARRWAATRSRRWASSSRTRPRARPRAAVAVTGKDADRFNFKVPTLRNVEMTYPYFHDGAANTLKEAVDVMGRLQLGKKFTATRTPRSSPS
jgi:cytochrome c peroxidase